ncbi:MAG TPA: DUF4012 domain-containing protein [Actinomycetota bacterium]|nr:DUF4012 domain-containing protein [Actinomycetota bacterium]
MSYGRGTVGDISGNRKWVRTLVGALIVVAALLVVDGVYVAFKMRSSLQTAADRLENARATFDAEDTAPVEDALSDAVVAAGSARGLSAHPAFWLARRLPYIGGDVATVDSLADATDLAARAGLAGLQAIEAAGSEEGASLAAAVYRDGVVNLRAVARADPKVREAARLLAQAEERIASAPGARFNRIQAALEQAEAAIAGAAETAEKGVAVIDALPGLLAQGGVKEYFLAFQSPSEVRGSGGFAGVYGILTAEDGRLTMGEVAPISALGIARPPVDAPGWFHDLYRDAGALIDPRQANYSPNFPVVSEVWLEMYERKTGQRLDGVVGMDPVALAELTEGTGPIKAPGLDRQVGPDNAVDTLLYDSYVEFDDPRAQQAYLGKLIEAFWARLGSGRVDAQAFASGLADSANTGHFKIYATDKGDQGALVRVGASGDYTTYGGNLQLIYANNAAANKIDFFMHRTIETDIRLNDDGSASVTTRVTLANKAPSDAPDSLVFGPGIEGDEAGLNAMVIYALLPEGSQLRRFSINGERRLPAQGREDEHPVAYDVAEVPAGNTGEVEVVYRMRDAWSPATGELDFVFHPQANVPADRYRITITAADGSTLGRLGTAPAAQSFTARGRLSEPVEVHFEPGRG